MAVINLMLMIVLAVPLITKLVILLMIMIIFVSTSSSWTSISSHMRSYAAATWATMEAVHHLMLEVIVVEVNVLLASKHIFTNSVEVNLHNMLGKKNIFLPTTGWKTWKWERASRPRSLVQIIFIKSARKVLLILFVLPRYENNLTNVTLFANLTLEGLPELVPGRLFTTRCCYDDGDDDDDARACAGKTFHDKVFLLNCCDLFNVVVRVLGSV